MYQHVVQYLLFKYTKLITMLLSLSDKYWMPLSILLKNDYVCMCMCLNFIILYQINYNMFNAPTYK